MLKKMRLFTFLTLALLSFQFIGCAKAQAPGGEGLTISPPIVELSIDKGGHKTERIRISNPTGNLIEFYPRVMDFGAKGETGEPAFFEPSTEDRKFSLAKWISFKESKIALEKDQVIEFDYTIKVPADAEPGGHYGVLFFASEPPKSDGTSSQVSLGSMVGSLVLVKVPGAVVEKGFIEQLGALNGWNFKNQAKFITKISNEGNVHFKPEGHLVIKTFGGKKIDSLEFNQQKGNVLPDTMRKFENTWKPEYWRVGRFTAELTLAYGENEQLFATAVFWMIPWWLIILVALLVLIIVGGLLYRKRKKVKIKIPVEPKKPQGPPNTLVLR